MQDKSFCSMIVAVSAFVLVGPLSAQEPSEPELAPIVKRLSGEDLPAALHLSTFVSKLDKSIAFDPELAKKSLVGRGLQVSDSDLDLFDSLYGDFDEDQGARHQEALQRFGGRSEEVRDMGEELVLERASFTGGVLGSWLAHLRDEGEDTDRFLMELVETSGASAFWGGRAPTLEGIQRRATAFERSFRREYGVPLEVVLRAGEQGGGR